MVKWRVFFFLFLLLALGSVFGEDKAALTNQLAFVWDVRIGAPDENRQYAEIITRSILISLEQKSFKPIPAGDLGTLVPTFDRTLPLEQTVVPKLLDISKEQGSSFIVLVSYYKEDIYFYLEIHAWDQSAKLFYEAKDKARTGLELYNRLNDATAELVARAGKVEQAGPAVGETGPERQRKGRVQQIVLLSGDDGCEIYVNHVMRVGVIVDGRLLLPFMPLNVGSKITVEKRKPGYYSDTEEFVIEDEWAELPLRSMEKIVWHEIEFVYTVGQFVGFGLGYNFHFLPRSLYLGVEDYFYLQTSSVSGNHTVIHDDLRILAGLYLISIPGVPLKVGLSTGLGCIFTYLQVPPYSLYTDFYFNLLNIAIEFRLWQLVFFVREEIKMGLGIGNNLLGGNFIMIRGGIPIFTFGMKISL